MSLCASDSKRDAGDIRDGAFNQSSGATRQRDRRASLRNVNAPIADVPQGRSQKQQRGQYGFYQGTIWVREGRSGARPGHDRTIMANRRNLAAPSWAKRLVPSWWHSAIPRRARARARARRAVANGWARSPHARIASIRQKKVGSSRARA
jgi:hypothetical protein